MKVVEGEFFIHFFLMLQLQFLNLLKIYQPILSSKNHNPDSNVVLISGDGAFLSGGMSIESVFYEKKPITVVIDNNGGLASIGQQQELSLIHI